MSDAIERLSKLLEGVPMCFCTVCSHDPAYGHCYSCRCANRQPEPIIADVAKLKITVDHWREIAVRACQRLAHKESGE